MSNQPSNKSMRNAIDDYGTRVATITKKYITSEYDDLTRDKRWKEAAETLEQTIIKERQAWGEYVIGEDELVHPKAPEWDRSATRNRLKAEQRKRNAQKEGK